MAKPIIKPHVKRKETGDVSYRQLLGALKRTASHEVIVGILDPNTPYPDENVTLGQVAAWMEFGTHDSKGNVMAPSRSFLRAPLDHGRRGISRLKERLLQALEDRKISVQKAYEALGQDAVRRMQNAIMGRIPPSLAPSTLARRLPDQGTIPLLRTTFLFKHIGFSVRSTKGK
jgi:hypothetical protein